MGLIGLVKYREDGWQSVAASDDPSICREHLLSHGCGVNNM